MINQYIEKYSQLPGCILFPPCQDDNIKQLSSLLSASGFSPIPPEYKIFLKITDGLTYNGVEFFGTRNHNRPEKSYTFPDLAASTFHYEDYDFFKKKIVIGRISECLLLYDKNSDRYAIADRLTLRSLKEFNTFIELFKLFCK